MQRQLLPADEEPKVVEGCELIIVQVLLTDVRLQHLSTEEQHRPHLEVIADRTKLIVDERHRADHLRSLRGRVGGRLPL